MTSAIFLRGARGDEYVVVEASDVLDLWGNWKLGRFLSSYGDAVLHAVSRQRPHWAWRTALDDPQAEPEWMLDELAHTLGTGRVVVVRVEPIWRGLDEQPSVMLRDLIKTHPEGPTTVEPDRPSRTQHTTFEVRLVDELGEPIAGVPVRVSAGGDRQLTTDGSGVVRVDDAEVSFGSAQITSYAVLREELGKRWSEARGREWILPDDPQTSTIVRYHEPIETIALRAKTSHTIVVQPSISRARVVGAAFDTNKVFLRPNALPCVQAVVELYARHPRAQLLVVGHTDTTGEPSANDPLSLNRARSVIAYLTNDVDAWLDWYDTRVPASRRWGGGEDRMMLDEVLLRRGETPAGDRVVHFQDTRGLQVDGDIGPQTRRALVTEYMGLDGTSLPPDITPVAHGCGENFPLAEDGVELDVHPPDGENDPTDRRVELLFFDPPFGVLPMPPGDNSPRGGVEYLEWRRRAQQTDDFLVTRQRALAVRVTDARTAEPIVGATVMLGATEGLGVEGNDGSLDDSGDSARVRPTDVFGVSAFFDLAAGAYAIQVLREGFHAFVGGHLVGFEDAPTVIPVALRPVAKVDLRLCLSDPQQQPIAFPPGVPVKLAFEDGGTAEATTDDDGIAAFEFDRRDGRFSVTVELGAEHYIIVPADETPTRRTDRDAAHAAAAEGHRFARLPQTMPVSASRLLNPVGFDDDSMLEVASAAEHTRNRGPVVLQLAPRWQVLQFEFHDRFHRVRATVPGATTADHAPVILGGHEADDLVTPQPEDLMAESAWSIAADRGHVHCLPWFPQGADELPRPTNMVRFSTPPSTWVVATSRSESHVETIPAGSTRITEPSAERLRLYDLPADWRSAGAFARPHDRLPTDKVPWRTLATADTSVDAPLVVSFDDIVLATREDGKLSIVTLPRGNDPDHQIAILDDRLSVYKQQHTRPKGYGEPYFTDRRALTPSSETSFDVPSYLLLDHPTHTRAVLVRDLHDVFDQRTPVGDHGAMVGARMALADAKISPSPGFFHLEHPHVRQWPLHEVPAKTFGIGRCSIAVLRCCGMTRRDEVTIELFGVLRWTRVNFDFAPSGESPAGGRHLQGNEIKTGDEAIRFVSQALTAAASRFNGQDEQLVNPVLSIVDPTKAPEPSPKIEVGPMLIEFGEPVTARGRHVVLFQRGRDRASGDRDIHIRLYRDVRASIGPTGDSDWDLKDLEVTTPAMTTAHELGHALGLPDEYGEPDAHASAKGNTISDVQRSPGNPYGVDTQSMMNGNSELRNRYLWPVAIWLVNESRMFENETAAAIVRGELRYSLPITKHEEMPCYVPIARTPQPTGAQVGRRGLCDIFMYRLGADDLSTRVLKGSSPLEPYTGLIVARLKIAVHFENPRLKHMLAVIKVIKESVEHLGSRAVVECTVDGQPMLAPIVFSPRFVVTTFPIAEPPDADDSIRIKYLASLSYRDPRPGNPLDPNPLDLNQAVTRKRRLAHGHAPRDGARPHSSLGLVAVSQVFGAYSLSIRRWRLAEV